MSVLVSHKNATAKKITNSQITRTEKHKLSNWDGLKCCTDGQKLSKSNIPPSGGLSFHRRIQITK